MASRSQKSSPDSAGVQHGYEWKPGWGLIESRPTPIDHPAQLAARLQLR